MLNLLNFRKSSNKFSNVETKFSLLIQLMNLIRLLGVPLSHKSYTLNTLQDANTFKAPQNKIIKVKCITSALNQYYRFASFFSVSILIF